MPIIRKPQNVQDYENLIERYKVQNPVKYALKEKELKAKLALLKGQKPEEPEVKKVVEVKKEEVKVVEKPVKK